MIVCVSQTANSDFELKFGMEREIRSTRNPVANYKETKKGSVQPAKKSANSQRSTTTATVTSTQLSSVTTTANINRLSSLNKPTVNTSRLSTTTATSRSSTPTAQSQNLNINKTLESRVTALEALVSQLTSENSDLRQLVSSLQLEVAQCKDRVEQHRTATTSSENNISLDQQELNSNIVIRGVEVKEDTPESELLAVYEGIRSHLNISEESDLAPVSVSVLSSNPAKSNNFRPFLVQLPTVAAKVKFLQIRRIKKDILLSDIGINSTSRRPILISEQLTRTNQELLFQARSLRGQNKFKFVWSTNGQILARHSEKSKVIRIIDTAHVNRLREEFNLEPLP